MFKKIRIAILLFILFLVGANSYLTQKRITDWNQPLIVVIYPINADGSSFTEEYIGMLTKEAYNSVEQFMQTEAKNYNIMLSDPVSIDLAPEVKNLPPTPPFGSGTFAIMFWSLKLQYWSWKHDTYQGPAPDIKVFTLYHDPHRHSNLDHSFGIKEGHISMVKAFATRHQAGSNNVVITHELLHTLGATDKYDLQTLQPRYPEGYAEPDKKPLLPQDYAEIMGRAIPLSPSESQTPTSLSFAVVGPLTAREIKWLQ